MLSSIAHSVSIHATLAGGDWKTLEAVVGELRFYPRHPRGWRLQNIRNRGGRIMFLSTPPSRVATRRDRAAGRAERVSIHATLAGGDFGLDFQSAISKLFLSTPPSRVATCRKNLQTPTAACFYPRHPRGWRLGDADKVQEVLKRFYPRHPRGWRLIPQSKRTKEERFYPRHPRGWRRCLRPFFSS